MRKLIIHDLGNERDEYISKLFAGEGDTVDCVSEKEQIYICTGCYGCWMKTPGECTGKDGYHQMSKRLHEADQLIIVSRCVYGGFSPFVKNVLDRSIGYMHPYFARKNGEMHHKMRYKDILDTQVYLYGNMNQAETETAQGYVRAVGVNFNFNIEGIHFLRNPEELADRKLADKKIAEKGGAERK